MKTVDYLDATKKKLGLRSDYAIAALLGCNRRRIWEYRHEKRGLENVDAMRIAEVLQLEPLQIIKDVGEEWAKSEADREYWRHVFIKAGTTAASAFLIVQLSLGGMQTNFGVNSGGLHNILYIMRSRKAQDAAKSGIPASTLQVNERSLNLGGYMSALVLSIIRFARLGATRRSLAPVRAGF